MKSKINQSKKHSKRNKFKANSRFAYIGILAIIVIVGIVILASNFNRTGFQDTAGINGLSSQDSENDNSNFVGEAITISTSQTCTISDFKKRHKELFYSIARDKIGITTTTPSGRRLKITNDLPSTLTGAPHFFNAGDQHWRNQVVAVFVTDNTNKVKVSTSKMRIEQLNGNTFASSANIWYNSDNINTLLAISAIEPTQNSVFSVPQSYSVDVYLGYVSHLPADIQATCVAPIVGEDMSMDFTDSGCQVSSYTQEKWWSSYEVMSDQCGLTTSGLGASGSVPTYKVKAFRVTINNQCDKTLLELKLSGILPTGELIARGSPLCDVWY
ncbi:hypothetical protein HYT52_02610 [Candidatus Woesearchaeota archaeon]|nr:hypothetical protein [Candidatus Woesearchaeota archaeon]